MARLGFQETVQIKSRLLNLTGLELEEFEHLKPFFEEAFTERMKLFNVDGTARKNRPYVEYETASLPSIEEKLFFVLLFIKQNLTQEVMAFMFGMSQSKIHEWLSTLIPVLKESLNSSKNLPAETKEELSENIKGLKSPLFVTTVPNAPLSDLLTKRSRKSFIAVRKKIIL